MADEFDRLESPRHRRTFVADDANLADAAVVGGLYSKLTESARNASANYEQIVGHHSELRAALDQHESILTIRADRDTESAAFREALTAFQASVAPAIVRGERAFQEAFLATVPTPAPERLALFVRQLESDRDLFSDDNVSLQTEIDRLNQEFKRINGAMTVHLHGAEHSMAELNPFLREQARSIREAVWRARAERRMKDTEELESVFGRIVRLRKRIALNAGLDSYIPYRFRELHRFDYAPRDCDRYRDAIEAHVRPLREAIDQRRRERLAVPDLRPWDMQIDVFGDKRLRPFDDESGLFERSERVFGNVDSGLLHLFCRMRDRGLYDLMGRKAKAPGGYCRALDEAQASFIFMNLSGTDTDLTGFFHECGHALHADLCKNEPLFAYRRPPIEFAEVAAFTMELFCSEHWNPFYDERDSRCAKQRLLEASVDVLCGVAQGDAFQSWLYNEANPAGFDSEWNRLGSRYFGDVVDIIGIERETAAYWRSIPHLYLWPLYFIEYGIAKLGALQLWRRYRDDPDQTLRLYKRALSLGGSQPLPELFDAAGISFDFSEATIVPVVDMLRSELEL